MNSTRWTVGVSLAVAAGLLAGACRSSATTSEAASVDVVDPTALLIDFGRAWDAADWESVGSLATSNVVEVAMEWYEDDGNAAEGLSRALDNGCLDVFDTGLTCQFVYTPPGGRGLIFNVTYGSSDTGLMVTDLLFGGDAG